MASFVGLFVMNGVKIGCCGFAGRRVSYFRRYPVIEIEQTFYDPPRVFTAEKWRSEAPSPFEFTVKAWQVITHGASSPTYHRMQTRLATAPDAGHFQPTEIVWNGWRRTREIALALQARTVLFQCPASFLPTPEHKENLRQFFTKIREEMERTQREFICIWEPRGDWKDDEVAELCDALRLVHAVDPLVRLPTTTECCYFRLHGLIGYRHRYTNEELLQVADRLEKFRAGYCLFNNLSMREDAMRLATIIHSKKQPPAEQNAA